MVRADELGRGANRQAVCALRVEGLPGCYRTASGRAFDWCGSEIPKGKLRPEQAVFLERIRCAGGVAFMARDCRDVFRELDITVKVQR